MNSARVPDSGQPSPGVQLEGLRLSSQRRGDIVIIAVAGELDIMTSRELDEVLAAARRERDQIILDLSAVEFMDTSSLAVIVGHWKKLEARGGTLALAGARYRYTKTLWITGLADRLPLYDTVDEAAAARRAAAEVAAGKAAAAEVPAAEVPAAEVPAAEVPAADAAGGGATAAKAPAAKAPATKAPAARKPPRTGRKAPGG
jgi:anti-sigma B factor antagonist